MIKILGTLVLFVRDGPAGGVDAIHLANISEVRGDHRFVVGERGSLLFDEAADVALFAPGFRIIIVMNPPLATVGLPRNAMKPRRSLDRGGQGLAIRVDVVERIPQAVAPDVLVGRLQAKLRAKLFATVRRGEKWPVV